MNSTTVDLCPASSCLTATLVATWTISPALIHGFSLYLMQSSNLEKRKRLNYSVLSPWQCRRGRFGFFAVSDAGQHRRPTALHHWNPDIIEVVKFSPFCKRQHASMMMLMRMMVIRTSAICLLCYTCNYLHAVQRRHSSGSIRRPTMNRALVMRCSYNGESLASLAWKGCNEGAK